ncbi:TRAF3-interacting protein 1 [Ceratitis capitata]|uniref:TRAF3-interacting protein 1 n=1 Tax=Ceratitis capitata TaxID=7213 RepID=UPI000A1213DF|nr:TRAF3-interacting protein 1 [Ceratitis capitata]
MADLDSSVIKRTQQTLGKYVKKPPLTEKLLTKPPFRFLHDVFNAVIKETGCFAGLYTPEELNSENIKDRDDKMRFLQKMIDVIKLISSKPLTVRTSKIVAGQEPEKTNELLQLIGEVVDNKLDWKNAVDEVLKVKDAAKNAATSKSKPPDKPMDRKTKDKENSLKETKAKEAKKVGKTITPTPKSEKPSKRPVGRDKEKTGKASKEQKDKIVSKNEKSKSLKPKTDIKEKSPLPLKTEDTKKQKSLDVTNTTSNEPTDSDAIGFGPKVVEQKGSPAKQSIPNENNRRNSKSLVQDMMASQLILDSNPTMETNKANMEPSNDAGSRKSSARQKRSSGSSRRSSANVTLREKVVTPISEPQNEKKDENENIQKNILEKAIEKTTLTNEPPNEQELEPLQKSNSQPQKPEVTPQQQSPTQTPMKPTPPPPLSTPTEVRRESTFTRDNSRESTSNNITNRPRTSLRPPSARPASARPGAPRRRDRNIEIVLQPNDEMKMSGINVKLESFGDLDDDGENLVVIEDASTVAIAEPLEDGERVSDTVVGNNLEQQGHLVQQILETQKEFQQQQNGNNSSGKSDKEMEISNNLTGRQSSARQMNNLRDIIQNLTKSVNPFGKLMDFIPEDIDAMQLELTMWRDTYTQVANELRREKSLTESATEPMKNQLVQLEANIKEFMEMIDASRSKILQNSEKILKMLTD